jgi:hypothetical protein
MPRRVRLPLPPPRPLYTIDESPDSSWESLDPFGFDSRFPKQLLPPIAPRADTPMLRIPPLPGPPPSRPLPPVPRAPKLELPMRRARLRPHAATADIAVPPPLPPKSPARRRVPNFSRPLPPKPDRARDFDYTPTLAAWQAYVDQDTPLGRSGRLRDYHLKLMGQQPTYVPDDPTVSERLEDTVRRVMGRPRRPGAVIYAERATPALQIGPSSGQFSAMPDTQEPPAETLEERQRRYARQNKPISAPTASEPLGRRPESKPLGRLPDSDLRK